MCKLTALEVRNRKEPGRLADGGGLSYEITKSGVKRWLYRYRLDNKQQSCIIGRYPDLSLEKARKAHREAKKLVDHGVNPSRARKARKQETIAQEKAERARLAITFQFVALEWVEQQRGAWSHEHAQAVLRTLENDVFGSFGDEPIDSITPPQVLRALRSIESRGSLEIAKKVLQRISAIFRYGIQTGRATCNPAADMKGVLKAKQVKHYPAVFDSNLANLLRDIAVNPKLHISTRLALQFTALTACRSGEVRGALGQG